MHSSKDRKMAEVEIGGATIKGGKLMLIIPLLGTLGGGAWAGFEIYKDYMDMKEIVQEIDIDAIKAENELVLTKLEDAIVYTRDIKNNLRDDLFKLESRLIEENQMTEEERYVWPNNKLIALSSASYKFEYLYKLYNQFEFLIAAEQQKDKASRCIMQYSYDCAPKQLYDENLINQAKATMSQSQFEREFGAIFTDDSSGYFKTSKRKTRIHKTFNN